MIVHFFLKNSEAADQWIDGMFQRRIGGLLIGMLRFVTKSEIWKLPKTRL
jgi:hypothetical protein